MKQKKITAILLVGLLLITVLTGCGTIKAMFNGAHEVYLEGENAWSKDKDGSFTLVKMAQTMKIDPEYDAPKKFLIENYDAIMTNINGKLSDLPRDNYTDLKKRTDIYKNMIDFHFYVTEGIVPNPVVNKDEVQLLETIDYTEDLEETSKLVIAEGIKEGKVLVMAGNFKAAESIFKNLISEFLEGDEETAQKEQIAAVYAAKARELSNSNSMDDIELGFTAIDKGTYYNGELPELDAAHKALNNKKGEILLAEAKDLIRKKDTASLIEAYKIYQKVIKIFPENDTYYNEAETLKVDIAETLYNEGSRMERNFDGKRASYDNIIKKYDAVDSWVSDYKGVRAKRDAFAKNAVIEIFIAVRHSGDDNTLQRLLSDSVASQLPKDRMFEIVSLNSPEGRELSAQVDMGSIPMGLAESYGFEYIILADNFRSSNPEVKSTQKEEERVCHYISQYGSIQKMSDSDHSSWKLNTALTGDSGDHLTYDSVSDNLQNAFYHDNIDEIWFNVKISEVTKEVWYEGRLDYSLSFYDVTSRRNWSKTQKIIVKSSSDEGRTGLYLDNSTNRLNNYLFDTYQCRSIEPPYIDNWNDTVLSNIKSSFKGKDLASTIIANIR